MYVYLHIYIYMHTYILRASPPAAGPYPKGFGDSWIYVGLYLMNFCQMNQVLTHIEPKLVVFQGLWRDLGFCLGASGHHIGASWLHIGCLMARLAQSWGIFGFLERFGALSWGIWASYWPILAPCWVSSGYVGSKLGHLEAILAPTERLWEPSWGS